MKKYEIILFDLDGTLTDPKLGITKSVQYALSKYDIKITNLDELEKFIGPPLAQSFKEYYSLDDEKIKGAIEQYREYFCEKGMYENRIYANVKEVLETLFKKGYILVVATSKPTVFAEQILEYFEIGNYFDLVVGSNLDGTRTDKAEIIEFIFSILDIKYLEEVIMVGDRKHDIIGAKKTGIDSIAVTYGYGSYEELKEENPTYFAKTIEDILKIVEV